MSYTLKSTSKLKILTIYSKTSNFSLITYKKFNYRVEKKIAEMLILLTFFLLLLISAMFQILKVFSIDNQYNVVPNLAFKGVFHKKD